MQENPIEVGILFKEMLIGVTSFFRDTAAWQMLKDNIFPALMTELPDGNVLRAWVPACSTGEEAYSLAITFKETLESLSVHKRLTFQIFATDLDSEAIEKARKGIFSKNITMVVFAPQNVIKDPPFTKLDFLSCRNMLIYMESELQKKLISLFSYCINPGGIMVLGTAETLGNQTEGFKELDAKLKIFKRLANVAAPELIDFPSSFYHSRSLFKHRNP